MRLGPMVDSFENAKIFGKQIEDEFFESIIITAIGKATRGGRLMNIIRINPISEL